MNNLKLALKNKDIDPKSWQKFQESIIEPQIRESEINQGLGYSQNQEFAMFRKSIMFLFEEIAKEHPSILYSEKYLKFKSYFEAIDTIVKDFDINY